MLVRSILARENSVQPLDVAHGGFVLVRDVVAVHVDHHVFAVRNWVQYVCRKETKNKKVRNNLRGGIDRF